jgi:predicted kinase
MTSNKAMLHLMCGKIATGKSTLSARLGAAPHTIVVSEDEWLMRLYPDEIATVTDYARCAARLREAIGPHLVALLKAGVTIVLDFPANTPSTRAWMRSLFEQAAVPHRLHYLDMPDALCRARLHARNAGGHPIVVGDEKFDAVTSYFVPPAAEEGFNVVVHQPE